MLNVAFRVDISNTTGTGHFMRMSALAEVFKQEGYNCVFYTSDDEPIDYSGFDIIIIDTYQVSDAYIAALNAKNRLLVCYDDNALYTYSCDILLNANLHADELRFSYGEKKPKLLLGSQYALLRREFREAPSVKIKKDAANIFICFGGSDLRNFTPVAVQSLSAIPNINLTVVLGAHTQNDAAVFELANENIKVYKTPSSVSDLIHASDIGIMAAGSMVYESAALGLPTLLVNQADNQLKIAEYMHRHKLMKWVGSWSDTKPDILRSETESLLNDFERRKTESERLKTVVNKDGAKEVVKEILNMREGF
jgi:spore coat polysaccharide biosynthesis predicted glycosyltransferase SpsG